MNYTYFFSDPLQWCVCRHGQSGNFVKCYFLQNIKIREHTKNAISTDTFLIKNFTSVKLGTLQVDFSLYIYFERYFTSVNLARSTFHADLTYDQFLILFFIVFSVLGYNILTANSYVRNVPLDAYTDVEPFTWQCLRSYLPVNNFFSFNKTLRDRINSSQPY